MLQSFLAGLGILWIADRVVDILLDIIPPKRKRRAEDPHPAQLIAWKVVYKLRRIRGLW